MSSKSLPGDGQYGKGSKGLPVGEPPRSPLAFARDMVRGMLALRRR